MRYVLVLAFVASLLFITSPQPAQADHEGRSWDGSGWWVTVAGGQPVAGPYTDSAFCQQIRDYLDHRMTNTFTSSCEYLRTKVTRY